MIGGGAGIWSAYGLKGSQYKVILPSGSSPKSFTPDTADMRHLLGQKVPIQNRIQLDESRDFFGWDNNYLMFPLSVPVGAGERGVLLIFDFIASFC